MCEAGNCHLRLEPWRKSRKRWRSRQAQASIVGLLFLCRGPVARSHRPRQLGDGTKDRCDDRARLGNAPISFGTIFTDKNSFRKVAMSGNILSAAGVVSFEARSCGAESSEHSRCRAVHLHVAGQGRAEDTSRANTGRTYSYSR